MKNLRAMRGRRPAGKHADVVLMRVEYDPVEHVFRLYRDGALYCATVVSYAGVVASFEVVDNTLGVYGTDGTSAFFDAAGQPTQATPDSSARQSLS